MSKSVLGNIMDVRVKKIDIREVSLVDIKRKYKEYEKSNDMLR